MGDMKIVGDKRIRCDRCGVVLIDPRKMKIRSCSHYPITIEQIDDQRIIRLGTKKSKDVKEKIGKRFDEIFEKFMKEDKWF